MAVRYASRARRPLISSSYLGADPPGSSSALDSELVSDGKTAIESFSLEIGTTHHAYEALHALFLPRTKLLRHYLQLGNIHHSHIDHRIVAECSTAPFAITRTGAECRRRDANISDARAILSRPSRFRVFLEKLCNDARRFTPERTWLRTYFTPRIE